MSLAIEFHNLEEWSNPSLKRQRKPKGYNSKLYSRRGCTPQILVLLGFKHISFAREIQTYTNFTMQNAMWNEQCPSFILFVTQHTKDAWLIIEDSS